MAVEPKPDSGNKDPGFWIGAIALVSGLIQVVSFVADADNWNVALAFVAFLFAVAGIWGGRDLPIRLVTGLCIVMLVCSASALCVHVVAQSGLLSLKLLKLPVLYPVTVTERPASHAPVADDSKISSTANATDCFSGRAERKPLHSVPEEHVKTTLSTAEVAQDNFDVADMTGLYPYLTLSDTRKVGVITIAPPVGAYARFCSRVGTPNGLKGATVQFCAVDEGGASLADCVTSRQGEPRILDVDIRGHEFVEITATYLGGAEPELQIGHFTVIFPDAHLTTLGQ